MTHTQVHTPHTDTHTQLHNKWDIVKSFNSYCTCYDTQIDHNSKYFSRKGRLWMDTSLVLRRWRVKFHVRQVIVTLSTQYHWFSIKLYKMYNMWNVSHRNGTGFIMLSKQVTQTEESSVHCIIIHIILLPPLNKHTDKWWKKYKHTILAATYLVNTTSELVARADMVNSVVTVQK